MNNTDKQIDPFNGLKQTEQDDEAGLRGMINGKDEERYQSKFLGGGVTIK